MAGRHRTVRADGMPSPSHDQDSYTTEDEKYWLHNLGDAARTAYHVRSGTRQEPIPDKATLLRSYLESSKDRVTWGDVNPLEARAYARKLLTEVEGAPV